MVYKALQKNPLKTGLIINGLYALALSLFVSVSGGDKISFFMALGFCYLYALLFWLSLLWIFQKKKRAWLLLLLKYGFLLLLLTGGAYFFELSSFLLALSSLFLLFLSYIFYQIKNYPG